DQRLVGEGLADDHDLEVTLGPRLYAVVAGLVDDLEHARREAGDELVVNAVVAGVHAGGSASAAIGAVARVAAMTCAMSRTSIDSSLSKCFMPSEIIVLQKGQPTATASTPDSTISLLRLTLTRFSGSSSIHIRP